MQAFWRVFRIEFYAFSVPTVLLIVFLAGTAWGSLPLIARGVETDATMTVLSFSTNVCRGDSCPGGVSDGQTYYSVQRSYDFTTGDGDTANFQRTGTQSTAPVVGNTNSTSIIYLPDNPQSAKLGTRAALLRELRIFVVLTGLAVTGLLALAGWRMFEVRRTFALARSGKLRRATVIQTPDDAKGGFSTYVHWKLSNGRIGYSLPLAAGEKIPRPKERIAVLDDGTRGAWADQIAPETTTEAPV
ncbi:MAG: hypothetical protein EA415_10550 [Sphaerobacteraceae bacterium]|nr:MAG: hypothetical protein EA415_10550 [Sphaerobacteraceae bacterium]